MNDSCCRTRRWLALLLGPVLAVLLVAGCGSDGGETAVESSSTTGGTTATSNSRSSEWPVTDLVLDPNRNYGDKYADGILPVGDGRLVLDGPQSGSVYLCNEGGEGGGATARGPWFVSNDTEYDINQKIHVEGEVDWKGDYSVAIDGDERVISTNAVPDDHATGQFPVAADDPAYQYDRNPNTITEQSLAYRVSALPQLLDEPHCMSGEAGVMTTGVALFNAFDAGNRDAGAWEIQDGCDGHPERTGEYHYHTLSSCIADVGSGTLIGWALDGLPITGPHVGDGNVLTTSDLDECHGITGPVDIDGVTVQTYHYVMTQDFPYSVSCFRATPASPPGRGVG
jgi:YHYH protein